MLLSQPMAAPAAATPAPTIAVLPLVSSLPTCVCHWPALRALSAYWFMASAASCSRCRCCSAPLFKRSSSPCICAMLVRAWFWAIVYCCTCRSAAAICALARWIPRSHWAMPASHC